MAFSRIQQLLSVAGCSSRMTDTGMFAVPGDAGRPNASGNCCCYWGHQLWKSPKAASVRRPWDLAATPPDSLHSAPSTPDALSSEEWGVDWAFLSSHILAPPLSPECPNASFLQTCFRCRLWTHRPQPCPLSRLPELTFPHRTPLSTFSSISLKILFCSRIWPPGPGVRVSSSL